MVTINQLRAWIPQSPSDSPSWYMWCQRLMWNVCNDWGSLQATYGSATAAYYSDATVIESKDDNPPAGSFVWWAWNPDGHVGLSLGGYKVLMTAAKAVPFEETWANSAGVIDIRTFNQMSGLRYLGWSRTNGANSVAVESGSLAPNERRSTGVKARPEPSTGSAAVEDKYLAPGEVGTFNGWVRGENVSGEDRWLRGEYSGLYFWLGGLEPQNVDGIPEITVTLKPFQRQVRSEAVRERAEATTDSESTREFPRGDVLDFDGWTRGQSVTVDGVVSDIWFRGAYGKKWFAAACFTSQDTAGLTEVKGSAPPAEAPANVPGTGPEPTPGLVTPAAGDFPAWIDFEAKLDPEVAQNPLWNRKAQEYYGVPYGPIESHVHWWGEPGRAGSHDGNVSHLNSTPELGANFVVSAGRVTLTTPLDKIAFTTGKRNPYGWKTENDPALTDLGYLTLGYLHYIVEKLNPRLRGEPIRLHKEFQATSCSGVDVARVRRIAEEFRTGALDPATGRPPAQGDPTPVPAPEDAVSVKRSWLEELLAKIKSILG